MPIISNNDGSTIVTTFTSSGTWTKDDRTNMVTVIGWGGGGGSLNGTNSGAGGDGGDGYVIVIEYLI